MAKKAISDRQSSSTRHSATHQKLTLSSFYSDNACLQSGSVENIPKIEPQRPKTEAAGLGCIIICAKTANPRLVDGIFRREFTREIRREFAGSSKFFITQILAFGESADYDECN